MNSVNRLEYMADYPYQLERGSKKYLCRQCGKKTFKRVIETASGRHLPDYVGRCDCESNCGYEYTWKQYFADNPEARSGQNGHAKKARKTRVVKPDSINKNGLQIDAESRFSSRKPDYLDLDHLLQTLTDYDQNSFVKFLLKLFPNDTQAVFEAVKDYRIGTKDGFTVFPMISNTQKVCKAKLIQFDQSGHTLKYPNGNRVINSLEAKLKKAGRLNEGFETDKNVFFGEHLLRKFDRLPIGVVEAEKTAVIASICKGAFPFDLVWLATGSKSWLNVDRIKRLGSNRKIILYPDADGFEKWQSIASGAQKIGLQVKVSDLIERHATDAEKANQVDLADYLISMQSDINAINAKIEQVKASPELNLQFNSIAEERKSILIFDGKMGEEEAEAYVCSPEFRRQTIESNF